VAVDEHLVPRPKLANVLLRGRKPHAMRGHGYAGLFAATRGKPGSDPVTETCRERNGFVPEASENPLRSMERWAEAGA
jgi:hypothetical protein